MTAHIPKLKFVVLGLAVAAVFAATVLFLLRFMPAPHTSADYLIMGGLATFVSLLVVFGALVSSILKTPDPFFKRRRP